MKILVQEDSTNEFRPIEPENLKSPIFYSALRWVRKQSETFHTLKNVLKSEILLI